MRAVVRDADKQESYFQIFCALWPCDLASLTIGDRSILMVLITVGEKKKNQIPFWSWNGSKVEHTCPAKGDLFGACVFCFLLFCFSCQILVCHP